MLKLGEKIIKDLYLGDKAIAKVFLGARLIYQKIVGEPIFLDYVEFDGNSWIDTKLYANSNWKVRAVWETSTTSRPIYGSYESGKLFSAYVGANWRFDGTPVIIRNDLAPLGEKHTTIHDRNGVEVNGTLYPYQSTPNEFTASNLSFYVGTNNSANLGYYKGKLYSLAIWDNDVLILDIRPCIDPKGNESFYHMVTKKYFYNQDTGTLTAGNKINFVDYIIFDGESWIDVDYMPSSNTRVVGKTSFTDWKNTGANYVFGVFGDSANFGFNAGSNRAILNVPWGSNSGMQMTNNTVLGQVYSFDISKNGAYIDGVLKISASQLSATFTANKSLFVGWSNGTSTEKLIGNVYPIQMYENDVLVKDLRPCILNDVVGLYDMVTCKFHTNIGSGTLKVPHIELDYIITDGNSYIDTEYYPNENTYIEYTFEIVKAPPEAWNGLFGSRQDTAYYAYNIFCRNSLSLRLDYGRYTETSYQTALNTKYTMKAGLGEIYINDELVKSYTPQAQGTSPYSMYLGNFNNKGTPYTTGTSQKIYPCKIYESGVLVRNFKPCIVSNGQVAMYDEVNNKYYYGQGTGTLKPGGRFVTSILFDGASYINTGIAHQTCIIETTIRFEETGTRQLMGFGSSSGQYWGKAANQTTFEYFSGTNAMDKTDVVLECMCDDPTAPYLIMSADGKTRAGATGTRLSSLPYIIGGLITSIPVSNVYYTFTGEVWGNKTIVNGVVIQDLRPYVDSDGVACFKDVVTGNLFYNNGEGTLAYTE